MNFHFLWAAQTAEISKETLFKSSPFTNLIHSGVHSLFIAFTSHYPNSIIETRNPPKPERARIQQHGSQNHPGDAGFHPHQQRQEQRGGVSADERAHRPGYPQGKLLFPRQGPR